MSEIKSAQSQSTTNPPSNSWSSTQAYVLSVLCLLIGVALGYLFRGSASSPTSPAAAAATQTGAGFHQQQQPDAQTQAALAQAAAPLLEAVNKNPNDYDSLVKLGNVFYDGQQYTSAIQYYERALAIHPDNPDVRTDMGTAYWYTGDADKALAAMETSLKYRPGHPQTLFNLGWVRWQGKGDAKGAVEAWQELLKANPEYPQKEQVEQYIAKAKEHAARG
jgi:cytochrome c-type biogenesis protein CcmH/NrfG